MPGIRLKIAARLASREVSVNCSSVNGRQGREVRALVLGRLVQLHPAVAFVTEDSYLVLRLLSRVPVPPELQMFPGNCYLGVCVEEPDVSVKVPSYTLSTELAVVAAKFGWLVPPLSGVSTVQGACHN